MRKTYKQFHNKGKPVREHRVLLAKHLGKPIEELGIVDHIDGDIHNNDLSNLREVTHQQNMLNKGIPSNNKTGIKGLIWDTERGKWRAYISLNRKQVSKRFEDKQEAVEWLKVKRKELHGEYSRQ